MDLSFISFERYHGADAGAGAGADAEWCLTFGFSVDCFLEDLCKISYNSVCDSMHLLVLELARSIVEGGGVLLGGQSSCIESIPAYAGVIVRGC